MTKKIDGSVLDALLQGCDRPEDLLGDGGLMQGLKKALMERMLSAELTAHLGYPHGAEAPPAQANRATARAARRCAARTARWRSPFPATGAAALSRS